MLHPRLTSLDGTQQLWLAAIGPYGSWGDLTYQTRWGGGASGMFEASWTMPLPADFQHSLLRRGSLVELMDGSLRFGSSLVLSEPAVGTGVDNPWTLTATGIGREVEGADSFYAESGGSTTTIPSAATDQAITDGWRIAGRLASVPTIATGGATVTDELMTCGSLFNAAADSLSQQWGVNSDNYLFFAADPTTPTYHVVPGAAALGTTDDNWASVVKFRYLDSTTGTFQTSTATNSQSLARFGRKVYAVNRTQMQAMSAATALGYANGILAKVKGRLGWTNSLSLTSNQILTSGGVPADLPTVAEDVGRGSGMVRLHGLTDDLLETNYLDIVIEQARLTDGGQTIDLSPAGLAPRDLAAVIEEVTGYSDES